MTAHAQSSSPIEKSSGYVAYVVRVDLATARNLLLRDVAWAMASLTDPAVNPRGRVYTGTMYDRALNVVQGRGPVYDRQTRYVTSST